MRLKPITPRSCAYCSRVFTPSSRRPAQRFCSHDCGTKNLVPLADRLAAFTVQSDGCWQWTGSTIRKGYGTLSYQNRHALATHAAWFVRSGQWPVRGQVIAHTCDEPSCVRNDGELGEYVIRGVAYPRYGHLVLTTPAGNSADMLEKGRHTRKPRTMIPCACGCGTLIETPDSKARPRRYMTGHNVKRWDRVPEPTTCACGCGTTITTFDSQGRPRKYALYHMAKAERPAVVIAPCACGCGAEIETMDRKGRPRRYVHGHSARWRRVQS